MTSTYRIIPYEFAARSFSRVMSNPGGYFIGRIGGSDWDLISWYYYYVLAEKLLSREQVMDHGSFQGRLAQLKEWNGYYDRSESLMRAVEFCDRMLAVFSEMDLTTVGNANFMTNLGLLKEGEWGYSPNDDGFYRLAPMKSVVACELITYTYIEDLKGFLREVYPRLSGKKVLVCSPFSDSYKRQYVLADKLFTNHSLPGFVYPQFELKTLTTPITYRGAPSYPHDNWFQTCEALCDQISEIDFDVALLSCGSYALELGSFIKKLGKGAIYMGGALQLFFGVAGRKYLEASGPYYRPLMNEHWIRPMEAAACTVDADAQTEGWGAYW
jgi:hypothetical protein